MKLLYTLLFLLTSLTQLPAQATIDNCNTDTSVGIQGLIDTIEADQPYLSTINQTYCFEADAPFVTGKIGTVLFSSDIPFYPFTVRVTDIASGMETDLTAFEDSIEIFNGRFYFLEMMPHFEGEGGVALVPNATNPLIGAFAQPDTVQVVVEDPAPVTWQRPLSYRISGKQVDFDWSVTDQLGVKNYTLQMRLNNGWADVKTLDARQAYTSEIGYTTTDVHRTDDLAYRVKQTDFDGAFSFGNIIMVPGTGVAQQLSVFPNPAREVVNFSSPEAISGLRLLNTAGRPVRELNDLGTIGRLSLAGLPAGIYLLELTDVNGERVTRRVLHK